MRNRNNGVVFECENPMLLHTQRVASLSEFKGLILRHLDQSRSKEIGRIGYRMLAPIENGVFRFRLFWLCDDDYVRLMFDVHGRIMCEQVMELSAEIGEVGDDEFRQLDFVQDDQPLAPPLIHVARSVYEMDVDDEESDDDYVADSNDNDSSVDDDKEELVPETLVQAPRRYLLPGPQPIPSLSSVPCHYHTLDMDTMQERNPFFNTGENDYKLDEGLEFRVGHRFKSRKVVLEGVKNYSIRRSAEYRVLESNRLKYHVHSRQHQAGCPWSLRVALRQNLGYW
ncbi:uncharacterized protein LOC130963043 [Arachis stenosperma]|uniref:uncharacterized protein LOC130963043 n=1 Tax=Arachis stenosperma TaxID=217475 RepID=UPI0025ABFFD4|nr:uncharacterized protein LOC130963043 [Arachis stenosperma]